MIVFLLTTALTTLRIYAKITAGENDEQVKKSFNK